MSPPIAKRSKTAASSPSSEEIVDETPPSRSPTAQRKTDSTTSGEEEVHEVVQDVSKPAQRKVIYSSSEDEHMPTVDSPKVVPKKLKKMKAQKANAKAISDNEEEHEEEGNKKRKRNRKPNSEYEIVLADGSMPNGFRLPKQFLNFLLLRFPYVESLLLGDGEVVTGRSSYYLPISLAQWLIMTVGYDFFDVGFIVNEEITRAQRFQGMANVVNYLCRIYRMFGGSAARSSKFCKADVELTVFFRGDEMLQHYSKRRPLVWEKGQLQLNVPAPPPPQRKSHYIVNTSVGKPCDSWHGEVKMPAEKREKAFEELRAMRRDTEEFDSFSAAVSTVFGIVPVTLEMYERAEHPFSEELMAKTILAMELFREVLFGSHHADLMFSATSGVKSALMDKAMRYIVNAVLAKRSHYSIEEASLYESNGAGFFALQLKPINKSDAAYINNSAKGNSFRKTNDEKFGIEDNFHNWPTVVEQPTTKQPTTKQPTTKQPTTKQPTTEEPTTKEPTTEEPIMTEDEEEDDEEDEEEDEEESELNYSFVYNEEPELGNANIHAARESLKARIIWAAELLKEEKEDINREVLEIIKVSAENLLELS